MAEENEPNSAICTSNYNESVSPLSDEDDEDDSSVASDSVCTPTEQTNSPARMHECSISELSDLSYGPSSIIVSPITQPLSPIHEPNKSPQSNEFPSLEVKPVEHLGSSATAESDNFSDSRLSSQESNDTHEDDNREKDKEFYRSLGITSIPQIPDTRTLSPTLTCSEQLDPERDSKGWNLSDNKNSTCRDIHNLAGSKEESGRTNGTIPTMTPIMATHPCTTTYTLNHTTNTTTATRLVDTSQSSLSLTSPAGSIAASLTASAPLFNKNASYTFTALNCNASSSLVVSGVNSYTKKNNIPAGSIYLPAQATAGEMKLPNSSKSVPMVMVPVPDGRTLMAIPMSSLHNSDINQMSTQANNYLKNNLQLKGHNLNQSGTLLTIQIPSTASSMVMASSNNATITNTTSITLTGSKSSATTFSSTVANASGTTNESEPFNYTPVLDPTINAAERNTQPSQAVTTQSSSDKPLLDEQAKKLLKWSDGVGTLDGCDFKFTLNEFGDLEVLDSDDEEENEDIISKLDSKSQDTHSKRKHEYHSQVMNDKVRKKSRYEVNPKLCSSKKVLPGSSLLSGGPDDKIRRTKPLTSIKSRSQQLAQGLTDANNTIYMNWQHLMERLMPQDRISQFKVEDVYSWTPNVVKKFVDSITGCAGNGCLFEDHEICGKSFMLMNQRDLVDILNVRLGPAVKIYHAILLVKEQSATDKS